MAWRFLRGRSRCSRARFPAGLSGWAICAAVATGSVTAPNAAPGRMITWERMRGVPAGGRKTMVPTPGQPAAAILRDDTATTSHAATWAINSAGGSMRELVLAGAAAGAGAGAGAASSAAGVGEGSGVDCAAPPTRFAGTTRAASSSVSLKKSSQAIQSLSASSLLGSSGYEPFNDACASGWFAKSLQLRSAWAPAFTSASVSSTRNDTPVRSTQRLLIATPPADFDRAVAQRFGPAPAGP